METIIKREPVVYKGEGSAIDNYFSQKPVGNPATHNFGKFDKNNKKHRLILSLLHQAGWTAKVRGKTVPDIERFGTFLEYGNSPVKKPLIEMDDIETEKLIKALKGIVKSSYK